MAGISRQSYSVIETGRSVPSTEISLRLAKALDLPVERIFRLEDSPLEIAAEDAKIGPTPTGRVRLARMGDRTIAFGLQVGGVHAFLPADGAIASRVGSSLKVRPLPSRRGSPDLVVAGCDPAFGIVARELEERGVDVLWVPSGSEAALKALARGVVHVAGVHLHDPESGRHNEPFVRRFVPFPSHRVRFANWEQLLVTASGNPLGISGIEDLLRPEVRLINREAGSGSRALLDLRLLEGGIAADAIPGYGRTSARSHDDVVGTIASGAADAGVAVFAAARARGLEGIPLAEEPYELVVPQHLAALPAVDALFAVLRVARVRSQIEALGGYDAAEMGKVA